jgi:hypothetical protein
LWPQQSVAVHLISREAKGAIMRQTLSVLGLASLVFLWSGGILQADVAGLKFQVTFQSSVNGSYPAVIEFNDQGSVFVNNEGQPDVNGTYTATGTTVTFFEARVSSSPTYEALLSGVVVDLKQSSVPVIQVLFANTPATIVGVGVGTDFDILRFSGEEILPTRSNQGKKRK